MSPITFDTINRLMGIAREMGYTKPVISVGGAEWDTLRQLVHTGRDGHVGFPILRLVREWGGDLRLVVGVESCLRVENDIP